MSPEELSSHHFREEERIITWASKFSCIHPSISKADLNHLLDIVWHCVFYILENEIVPLWWVIFRSSNFQFHNKNVIEKFIFAEICVSKVVCHTQPSPMREATRNQFTVSPILRLWTLKKISLEKAPKLLLWLQRNIFDRVKR